MNENEIMDIVRHYESYDEQGRFEARWTRIEYLTTLHYMERYIRPDDRILEIGAGTGRYSLELARRGYDVTSIELVPRNLEVLRSGIMESMRIHAMQGNALNLEMLQDETYDMTLLLGPMYHLFEDADKHTALSEALRVTKSGGIVMAAYCISDGPMINFVFKRHLYGEMVEKQYMDANSFEIKAENGFVFEHIRKEDIDRLMCQFPVERLHYVATDGLPSFMQKELEELDEETYQAVIRYHLSVCERPDLIGATAHSLDIFRKQ